MQNKFFSLLFLICAMAMVIVASYIGNYLPEHWTLGKSVSVGFFFVYEVACVFSFVYFWFKKN